MIPRIKINFLNGQLGTIAGSEDGLVALVAAIPAASKGNIEFRKPYVLHKYSELTEIMPDTTTINYLHTMVKTFYTEAEEGTKVIVWADDERTTLSSFCDIYDGEHGLKELIESQGGTLRGIFIKGYAASEAISDSVTKAQLLAEWSTKSLFAPIFVCLQYPTDIDVPEVDLTKLNCNRVCVVDGYSSSPYTCLLGYMAGRVASKPVQRNIGRVRDGALSDSNLRICGKTIENANSQISDLYDLGYITARFHVGRSGYYFTDDRMAIVSTDDYSHLSNRRTIDKAYRIAYNTLLDYLNDEIELNEDGTMQVAVIKNWQQTVENAINSSMTANGELSESDGSGCVCFIDESQNVVSTSTVAVTLKVRPFGYARYIDVNLGFQVTTTN